MASGDLTATWGLTELVPCASFDGVDDYIEMTHDPALLGTGLTEGITLSVWVNAKGQGESNAGRVFDKSASATATNGFRFGIDSSNRLIFRINGGTTINSAVNAIIAGSGWHHGAITCTAAGIGNVYIDGVLSGTANQNGGQATSAITTTNVQRIGNRSQATDATFYGLIRDLRVYNTILTSAELTKLANNENISRNLIGHWKLKEDALDSTSRGFNGTVSGAFFTGINFNQPVADILGLNNTTITDKIIALPVNGRNNQLRMITIERTP